MQTKLLTLNIAFLLLAGLCCIFFIITGTNALELFTGVRNQSYDIRGDPFILPHLYISPWNQSTIFPFPNEIYNPPFGVYLANEYIPPNTVYKPYSLFA